MIKGFIGSAIWEKLQSISFFAETASIWKGLLEALDWIFIIGLVASFFIFVWGLVKYGSRKMKARADETSKEEIVNWKKDLKGCITGFIIVVSIFIVVPVAFQVVLGFIGL